MGSLAPIAALGEPFKSQPQNPFSPASTDTQLGVTVFETMIPTVESSGLQDTVAMASTAHELFKFINLTVGSSTSSSEDASSDGSSPSLVWVILFSLLILASVTLNTVFILAVVLSPQWTSTYLLIIAFFLINLLDFALLLFEFSLGPTLRFVYSEGACSFYQLLLQAAPLLTAATFILLVLSSLPSAAPRPSTVMKRLLVGIVISFLLSLPSLAFSGLALYPSGARHCVLDLGGVGAGMGLPTSDLQLPTAIYYLVLRSILPYWVPLLMLPLLWRSMNSKLGTSAVISLPVTVAFSHAIFLLPLALVLTARYLLAASQLPLTSRASFTLDVLSSLALLISYFLPLFRPLTALVLEPSLRSSLTASPYLPVLEVEPRDKSNPTI